MTTRRGLAAITAGALLALGAVTSVSAADADQWYDFSGDGYTDTWLLDDDGDGSIDRVLIDNDGNGVAELLGYASAGVAIVSYVDSNNDTVYDVALQPIYSSGVQVGSQVWRDADQNGAWENAYYDGQLDGYFEWVLVDSNFDGAGDTWYANTAPAGYSATDEAARQVAAVGAFNILAAGNVPIFGPVAWPLGG